MMLIKCTSALRSAQKSSCSFPAHFVLTNAPQSRAARGFFSAVSARGDVLSSCSFDDLTTLNEQALSFDEQAEANEQALSFDEQAYKIKKHDIKEDDKITNAHRLTPIVAACRLLAQLTLRLCARSCRAMCAAFLARRSKPKHP